MKLLGIKRIMVAAALAVATTVSGMAGHAQAFVFGENDLVLAIYGNNTEALYNLGDFNTRLGSGATFSLDVSAGLSAAQVGTNPVKYTIFGWDISLPNGQVHAATKFEPGQVIGPLDLTSQFNPSAAWSGLVSGDPIVGDTIAKSDIRSFSANLNGAGDGKLGGAWPVAMQGELGDIMNIMRGNVETNTFTQVGRVLLSANGLLTIGNPGPNAVPLPAGVILFGTGVIGLIGIARRSFNKMAA